MKTTTKILVITGITWLVFLGLTLSDAVRDSLPLYTFLAILFTMLTPALLYIVLYQSKSNMPFMRNKSQVNDKTQISQKTNLSDVPQHDTLIGLPNRVFFNTILIKAINQAIRHKKILALLVINLDTFKEINSKYGKEAGDTIIKEVGESFANVLRVEDVIAKLEGDEFIVLLNDIKKPKFASAVAEKLLSVCSQPFLIDGKKISITASIGIGIFPDDGYSLEELSNNVNIALDHAKRAGKNNYQFYSHEMDTEAHEYIELAHEMRNALKNNEFVLYYQPKLHIKTGSISGVETLLRWVHPKHGLINPGKFLTIAEDTGLIVQIGEWALREACKINKSWQDEGYEHMTIAINLSPKQFYHPEIANMIAAALKETGLDPSYLEIEISESTVMHEIELTSIILDKIKKTGVRLTIDHFGTGYISISHLKNIPVSTIKIDKNFIKGVPLIPNDIDITNAFIALAHSLNLEVVAEGVETIEQAQHLATQNCDVVQGYFLSYPVPAQKIILQFKKIMDTIL